MRNIKYERAEFHGDDELVENNLLCFVYDIPYMGACGIFPPFRILNEIFSSGGGDGGMGPGAVWEPFIITEEEYYELQQAIITTQMTVIKDNVRYAYFQFEFDREFDNISDRLEWLHVVCNKHREAYHRKMAAVPTEDE